MFKSYYRKDHVIMQIGKMVMDAVKHHIRSVCGDVMDEMKGTIMSNLMVTS